ncbi:hypothetical protein ACF1AE_25440 [Streptomyces sp. NPDC014986]|uniref:hypothetical protein n=1 Tax=Streptomyces sp. NPDC014986 TaxID=3364934 RepID=UPI0036FC74F0
MSETPMTPERLAGIAARAAAATPGPWCTDAWEIYQGAEYMPGLSMWIGETCRGTSTPEQDRADAAFVAAARTDVPALLADAARLRTERDRYRSAWRMAYQRARGRGWAADRAGARARDAQEALQHMLFAVIAGQMALHVANRERQELRARVAELEAERHSTNEALDDAVQELRARETSPLTVYRASHDSIVMGLYLTAAEARKHCEAEERRSWPTGTTLAFDWIEDDEDGVAELTVVAGQNEESTTGYVVDTLEVAAAYDEEADE